MESMGVFFVASAQPFYGFLVSKFFDVKKVFNFSGPSFALIFLMAEQTTSVCLALFCRVSFIMTLYPVIEMSKG